MSTYLKGVCVWLVLAVVAGGIACWGCDDNNKCSTDADCMTSPLGHYCNLATGGCASSK
jgi:hypothetical protein